MDKIKKFTSIIIIFVLIISCILPLLLKNEVQAGQRTEDDSKLINYPKIYTMIEELKTAHPNWTFTILYTGLDWNTVLKNETTALHTRSLVNKSLVEGNVADWVCPSCGTAPKDNGSWYCASEKTVAYYMNPQNWLNEKYIFAFETLSFNPNVHTVEGVKSIIAGTFMDKDKVTYIDNSGKTQTIQKSYAQIIYDAGKKNNVSPYHLAARIRQEQGNGTSSLISGKYTHSDGTSYVGYYNYFNVAAGGNSTAEIIKNGLEKAKASGWTNPELAINGGAEFLKGGYIGNYQDTLYLQKYHVDSSSKYSLYGHQYQQNVSAPYTENLEVYSAYEDLEILDSSFNFIIPVYEKMPSTLSEKPGRTVTYVTEDVTVTTQSTDLSIRGGPSTNYSIKAKAAKGTTLIRIEKANTTSSDGRYWDKIAYINGTQVIIGYASREYLTDAKTVEKVSEEKVIGKMCNLRNGPSSVDTSVKQILQPGTKVTVIDKLLFKVYGHTWYRVKLQDGTQGYVSSAYFETDESEAKNYKIDGEYIIITPTTVLADIEGATCEDGVLATGKKIKIETKIETTDTEIKKTTESVAPETKQEKNTENTKTDTDTKVDTKTEQEQKQETTTEPKVETKTEIKEYTVIMIGDVSGDGVIKSKDYMMIKNYIMGTLKLSEIEKKAADVSKDNEIKSKDYMMIKNYIMGLSTITL